MKQSEQDRYYLDVEADRFFRRNMSDVDPASLRPYKRGLVERLTAAGVTPRRVIEFGCCFGDLLHHFATEGGAELAVGVEPSADAVARGRTAYGDTIRLEQGTLADNPISADPALSGTFDTIVIDDVFCWVSRETLFQSVANIDDLLADGGHLLIREFAPLHGKRNRNHHAAGEAIFCHKPAGPHYRIFTSGGTYAEVWQQVWLDRDDAWANASPDRRFEARWVDTVLRKSFDEYFITG